MSQQQLAVGIVQITGQGTKYTLPKGVEIEESDCIKLKFFPSITTSLVLYIEKPVTIMLELGEGAVVEMGECHQNAGERLIHINAEKNARLTRSVVCIDAPQTKIEANIHLQQGARVEDNEVFFLNETEHLDLKTNLHHQSGKSFGNVLIKGALIEKANALTRGTLHIAKAANQSETSLQEHLLLLSKEAKANAVPSLEIEANNVIAKHAASVTNLNQEQIFYLTSRALPEHEARKMVVQGFLTSCLNRMPTDSIQQLFTKEFEAKWNRSN